MFGVALSLSLLMMCQSVSVVSYFVVTYESEFCAISRFEMRRRALSLAFAFGLEKCDASVWFSAVSLLGKADIQAAHGCPVRPRRARAARSPATAAAG